MHSFTHKDLDEHKEAAEKFHDTLDRFADEEVGVVQRMRKLKNDTHEWLDFLEKNYGSKHG